MILLTVLSSVVGFFPRFSGFSSFIKTWRSKCCMQRIFDCSSEVTIIMVTT
jgi:hypothetical protein